MTVPGVFRIGETGHCFATRLRDHRRELEPRNLAKIDDNKDCCGEARYF